MNIPIPERFIEGRYERIYLSEPFDFKKHKDNFPYYTEVIITKEGTIYYAVPSHFELLVDLAQVTAKDQPKEYFCSTLDWLLDLTGAIAVWYDYYRGKPNQVQSSIINRMKDYGIYGGSLSPVS